MYAANLWSNPGTPTWFVPPGVLGTTRQPGGSAGAEAPADGATIAAMAAALASVPTNAATALCRFRGESIGSPPLSRRSKAPSVHDVGCFIPAYRPFRFGGAGDTDDGSARRLV